jgi:hypothetical protein
MSMTFFFKKICLCFCPFFCIFSLEIIEFGQRLYFTYISISGLKRWEMKSLKNSEKKKVNGWSYLNKKRLILVSIDSIQREKSH